MKKIFGISLGALFAALPMMAGAANIDLTTSGNGHIEDGDQNKAVSVSYVKGAYNELGAAINTKQDQLKNGETNISSAVSSAVRETGADNATLVTEKAVRDAIDSAVTDAGSDATNKINALTSTVSQTEGDITVSVAEQSGILTGVSASINAGAVDSTALADDAVTSAKIADNAVTAAAIAESAVTSNEIADGTIQVADIDADAMAAGSGTYAASTDLAQQGYVDEKIAGITSSLTSDYATKSGVAATINAVSYTAALDNTAVTGTVTAMSEWGTSATSAIAMTGSVTSGDVTVTRSGNASYIAE